ncbi:MAG: hypothetical protein GY797_36550 [Deltaproteobacteria bacterium]|nr:hypothetical protein [Deltaproteobacteria bacterium]
MESLATQDAPSNFCATTVTPRSAGVIELYPQSITQQPEIPAWTNHFEKRINEFLAVQGTKGSVNGVFLSREIIFKALSLLSSIASNNTEPPLIALNDDGSLHFEWENEKDFLTVTLGSSSNIEFYFESEDAEKPIENNTNDAGILRKILQNFQT